MDDFLFFIICVIFIYIVYLYFKERKSFFIDNRELLSPYRGKIIYVTSNDDLVPLVRERLEYIQDAGDAIADYCQEYELPTKERSRIFMERWRNIHIKEILPNDTHVAYLIDKNVEIRLCVRNSFTEGTMEKLNTTMFVFLHELGHVMSDNYDHGDEFLEHFMFMIRVGVFLGLYEPVHYSQHPTTYCKTSIRSSPCEEDG